MKMFKMTALSFVLITSIGSFSTMAAETSQISVKGAVFPSACSISVDGAADFGILKKNELQGKNNPEDGYQLGYKPINFNIQCNSAAKLALSAQSDLLDSQTSEVNVQSYLNEAESETNSLPEQRASLGVVDGRDIGLFTVLLASVSLNDKSAEILSDNSSHGSNWEVVTTKLGHLMFQDSSIMHSWGSTEGIPLEATNISGVINISAALDPKVVDVVKDAIDFNTGTTLSLHYL
ncbi:DUF1120 domain-containing protein [Serratia sp. NPDC078593]|uniref:DUF1120 domain-containing protein n=1 Tax=unclassified Serratia (in: enterobacteria) TaxID=2647522 RepID=UPI0037D4D6AF